jgi:hypothetical protein
LLRTDPMINIIFYNEAREPAAELELARLKVTGGVLWNHLRLGLIASYASGRWKHRGIAYPSLSIVGEACLVFGIARDPTLLSEPIQVFSFTGRTLRANGVPIAEYVEEGDVWQGLIRPMRWQSMRIESAGTVSAVADESKVRRFSPWDPLPLHRVRTAQNTVGVVQVRQNSEPPTRH